MKNHEESAKRRREVTILQAEELQWQWQEGMTENGEYVPKVEVVG